MIAVCVWGVVSGNLAEEGLEMVLLQVENSSIHGTLSILQHKLRYVGWDE